VKFAGRMDRTFAELLVGPPGSIAELLYHDPADDPWRGRSDPDDVVRRMEYKESFMHYVWEPYLHDPNLRQLLPRISPPVLIVAGTSDTAVTEGYYDAFARALPAAELVRVDEAGHYPEIEQPTRTTELAVQFVAKYWDQGSGLIRRDGTQ
jgi:pimeloyl-ACP methyl ester carboxylesterase